MKFLGNWGGVSVTLLFSFSCSQVHSMNEQQQPTEQQLLPFACAPGLGSSRNIPADATIEQVQTGLMEDFPTLGRMLVFREDYAFCACDDGFLWTITFDEV